LVSPAARHGIGSGSGFIALRTSMAPWAGDKGVISVRAPRAVSFASVESRLSTLGRQKRVLFLRSIDYVPPAGARVASSTALTPSSRAPRTSR